MMEKGNCFVGGCSKKDNGENKFVIMVDDTEQCIKPQGPGINIVQGHPIQQIYIDLSDCKKCNCSKEK